MGEDPYLYSCIPEDIGEGPFGSSEHRNPVSIGKKSERHVPHMDLGASDGICPGDDECNVHICKVASFRYCINCRKEFEACMYW
jgi:hypothetical protein